ncbi:hypothetical protein ZEAMMB73_Zm00001d042795 [Zea mays]|nr:hypothetical protein ZEAMMB73_Zm00001d042795 [Zea mays]
MDFSRSSIRFCALIMVCSLVRLRRPRSSQLIIVSSKSNYYRRMWKSTIYKKKFFTLSNNSQQKWIYPLRRKLIVHIRRLLI